MVDIDVAAAISGGMSDPEFAHEMRFFTGSFKVVVARAETVATFDDGKLVAVGQPLADGDCKVVIRGTQEHWDNMLAPYPVPFYQCLQTTVVKHGMNMTTTNESFAYLPAFNRLVQLLRAQKNGATNGAA